MVLYNAASRARNTGSLVNKNSGGGSRKMGLFPSVGNDSWTSVAYGKTPGKCFTLDCSRNRRYPEGCGAARPIGMSILVSRFKC